MVRSVQVWLNQLLNYHLNILLINLLPLNVFVFLYSFVVLRYRGLLSLMCIMLTQVTNKHVKFCGEGFQTLLTQILHLFVFCLIAYNKYLKSLKGSLRIVNLFLICVAETDGQVCLEH